MGLRLKGRTWIKRAAPFMCFALFLYGFWLRGVAAEREAAAWRAIVLTPEPDLCALCGYGARYHAPCLVDLSTGEIGEMQIYDRDPVRAWEISGIQQTGTFSLLRCAGLTAARDTTAHTCAAVLPRETEELAPEFFCLRCRAHIAETSRRGFILADLYDLADIHVYSLAEEAFYSVRDYNVSVSRRGGDGLLSVEITGRL